MTWMSSFRRAQTPGDHMADELKRVRSKAELMLVGSQNYSPCLVALQMHGAAQSAYQNQ
jgi:hypothetical protein